MSSEASTRAPGEPVSLPAGVSLAVALRRLRRGRGLSMRQMVEPLHLTAHSAVADYESGRRLPAPDILAAYERYFGLRPGCLFQLRERALEQRADWESGQAAGSASRPRGARPRAEAATLLVPAQLPHDVGNFVGRQAQLAQLHRLVRQGHGQAAPSAVLVCSIDGIPGVGKTALAVHFAHQIADRFPDGQLYLDLRGHDVRAAPLSTVQALGRLLRALGEDSARLPTDPDELAAHYRTRLAGRRVLLILDNAADTGQVRPLLPGARRSLALVTSRRVLSGLVARDGAHRTVVGTLSPDEALDLLVRTLGPGRVAREPEAAARIAGLCGYLPLALRIAVERVLSRPGVKLAQLAEQLADERTTLESLLVDDDESTGVRAAFSWSFQTLPEPQARLFRLLAWHPGPVFTLPAAAALAGVPLDETGAQLAALVAARLVEPVAGDRYRMHDLLRIYARERATAQEPSDAESQATARIASWYLHTAVAAARCVRPARRHASLSPPFPPVEPLTFEDYDRALAWLDNEYRNCVAAADAACVQGYHGLAHAFPGALFDVFDLRGLFEDWEHVIRTAIVAARAAGDARTHATLLSHQAIIRSRTGRPDDALELLHESLDQRRAVGDRRGEAATLGNIGNTLNQLGRPAEARGYFLRCARISHEVGDLLGEAMSVGNLGEVHERLGEYDEAVAMRERALALFQDLGDHPGQARILCNLATLYRRLGRTDSASQYGREALRASQACGARDIEAQALRELGHGAQSAGDLDSARRYWEQALHLLDELGDPDSTDLRTMLAEIISAAFAVAPGGPGRTHQ